MYDGIIIGGGHAGVEAALAMAKLNKRTLLITGDLSKVASLPCNPSIGGPAKGVVVREIDALGGIMGIATDQSQIQMKMLNASKGPAVRALRSQVDKVKYPKLILNYLKTAENLELLEAYVDSLIIEESKVSGVILENGKKITSKTVIITTGTYLGSKILMGLETFVSGPDGDKTTDTLSKQLASLGFTMTRLKTGTPPRIDKNTVDYSKVTIQPGDDTIYSFNHWSSITSYEHSLPCYLTHTSKKTLDLIRENLELSSMYGGIVEGIGPRYCPSIEDKVVRFSDKDRHQIFLEPESISKDTLYIQGLSTSMPKSIQEKMVKSVPGLENAKIVKYAYAIEYDAIDPIQLNATLETKLIGNLYCAGQINGTSGYEEAAGQGIVAGINASLKLDGKEPFILKRNEAYIGVLIDDLITKGVKEPYRLLTSRAEYRLLLRNDNADLRLTEYGYKLGLISESNYQKFCLKKDEINNLKNEIENIRINPTTANNKYLESRSSSELFEGHLLSDLLKRPELTIEDINYFVENDYQREVLEQVLIQVKYEGYIRKAQKEAEKMLKLEDKKIPSLLNYDNIKNLSFEAREKLTKIQPKTIGQATRILGVNPADIALIMVYLEGKSNVYK